MCGIFGIHGSNQAAVYVQLGLQPLQHRGQESCGIVSADGQNLHVHRAMGLVGDIFGRPETLNRLRGHAAIGHVRYSTTGSSSIENAQPIVVRSQHGYLAVAHNGNLVDAELMRHRLEKQGSIFQSTMDTEVIVHLMARSNEENLVKRLAEALGQVHGAYSLLFLKPNGDLIAVRDPMGIRPLCFGRIDSAWVFASESVAFDLIDATFVREVEPGEIVMVSGGGLVSYPNFLSCAEPHFCIFEYIYFARPDSEIGGKSVWKTREKFGRQLAVEQPAKADLVIGVPDSGIPAARGYAEESGIPFGYGLTRNHYVGRTFIEPEQGIRSFGVKLKLNPIRANIEGKRIVVVDDSIVRGTTARKIVRMLQWAGAKEVHLRISSPPNTWPCRYGIDTPTREELVASSLSVDQICKIVSADSLGYLSVEGMHRAMDGGGFCDACFTGNYPIPV